MIRKRDGKFQVTDNTGTKVLGVHTSKYDALAKLRAIELNKKQASK